MIWTIISFTELILYFMVGFTVLYLTVFAFASLFYSKFKAPRSHNTARFLVLIPAYKCDNIYEPTLKALEEQNYNRKNFDLLVVSAGNKPITNMKLAQHNLSLQIMPEEEYTDVQAWAFGIQHCPPLRIYDMVVILEAGETVAPTYLEEINAAYHYSSQAIQTHRSNLVRNTPREIMAATFEDINSSVFRMGHVALGMASGLLGSGMAFDFKWFRANIGKLPPGSDLKSFEALVLRERLYVDYLDDTFFYGKPSGHMAGLHIAQRSSWMYAQWHALRTNIKYLPHAILHHNYDLADKIIQWMLMPRVVMMAIITAMCLITPLFWWSTAIKWFLLGLWVLFIYAIATPDYLVDKKWEKAYAHAPMLMLRTLFYALPSGWVFTFAKNHHEEWKDEVIEQTEKLKEHTEKIVGQTGKLVGQTGHIGRMTKKGHWPAWLSFWNKRNK